MWPLTCCDIPAGGVFRGPQAREQRIDVRGVETHDRHGIRLIAEFLGISSHDVDLVGIITTLLAVDADRGTGSSPSPWPMLSIGVLLLGTAAVGRLRPRKCTPTPPAGAAMARRGRRAALPRCRSGKCRQRCRRRRS